MHLLLSTPYSLPYTSLPMLNAHLTLYLYFSYYPHITLYRIYTSLPMCTWLFTKYIRPIHILHFYYMHLLLSTPYSLPYTSLPMHTLLFSFYFSYYPHITLYRIHLFPCTPYSLLYTSPLCTPYSLLYTYLIKQQSKRIVFGNNEHSKSWKSEIGLIESFHMHHCSLQKLLFTLLFSNYAEVIIYYTDFFNAHLTLYFIHLSLTLYLTHLLLCIPYPLLYTSHPIHTLRFTLYFSDYAHLTLYYVHPILCTPYSLPNTSFNMHFLLFFWYFAEHIHLTLYSLVLWA